MERINDFCHETISKAAEKKFLPKLFCILVIVAAVSHFLFGGVRFIHIRDLAFPFIILLFEGMYISRKYSIVHLMCTIIAGGGYSLLVSGYIDINCLRIVTYPIIAFVVVDNLFEDKQVYAIKAVLFGSLLLSVVLLRSCAAGLAVTEMDGKYIAFSVSLLTFILLIEGAIGKVSPIVSGLCSGIVWFLIGSIVIVIWSYYSITDSFFDTNALLAILQTNQNEAYEYISSHVSLKEIFLLIVTIVFIIGAEFFCRLKLKPLSEKILILFAVLLIVSGDLVYQNRRNLVTNIFYQANDVGGTYEKFRQNVANREKELATFFDNFSGERGNDGLFVLVIGESQNRNHMSAYGYNRKTTPWLDEQANNPYVAIMKNSFSCHVYTVATLTYALTAKNQYNDLSLDKAGSIVEMAKAAGYKTVWLSNQARFGLHDTPIAIIGAGAETQIWLNDYTEKGNNSGFYDEALIKYIDDIPSKGKTFLVIHLMGNHGAYYSRYPRKFDEFGNDFIGTYDNSMRYNDYVMQTLTEKLETNPNFQMLMYFADHSDAVDKGIEHETTRYDKTMTHIPWYYVFSKSYAEKNPAKLARIKSRCECYITNDLVFNTMLSFMDIRLDGIYEPKNDILSDKYDAAKERFRTVYGEKTLED